MKKEKQWNCRAGIGGWHEENCPHLKQTSQQSDWESISDEIVINFFEELRPPKKGEAYTFLIPLMVELKCNLKKAVKQAQADGYAKGRIKCLEQHFSKELQQARAEGLKEVLPKDLNFDEASKLAIEPDDYLFGFKRCKKLIIDNALQKWGIKLK